MVGLLRCWDTPCAAMPDAPPLEAVTATGAGGSTLASGTGAVLAICGGRGGAGGVDTVGVATTGLGMRGEGATDWPLVDFDSW